MKKLHTLYASVMCVCISIAGCGPNSDRSYIEGQLAKYKGSSEAQSRIKDMDVRFSKRSEHGKKTFWADRRAEVDRELAPLMAEEKQMSAALSAGTIESSEVEAILKAGKGHNPPEVGLKFKGQVVGSVRFDSGMGKNWSQYLTLTLQKRNDDYASFPRYVGFDPTGAKWEAYNGHAVPGMKATIKGWSFFVEQSRQHMTIWR